MNASVMVQHQEPFVAGDPVPFTQKVLGPPLVQHAAGIGKEHTACDQENTIVDLFRGTVLQPSILQNGLAQA